MKKLVQLFNKSINHTVDFLIVKTIESFIIYLNAFNYSVLYIMYGHFEMLISGTNITNATKSTYLPIKS